MEFDRIFGMFTFPAEVEPGDFLLIGATGGYDFTNSYDFGDGISREICII
jgi:diaminopimelate decarboxylase